MTNAVPDITNYFCEFFKVELIKIYDAVICLTGNVVKAYHDITQMYSISSFSQLSIYWICSEVSTWPFWA